MTSQQKDIATIDIKLNRLNVSDLKQLSKNEGIPLKSRLNKSAIINTILKSYEDGKTQLKSIFPNETEKVENKPNKKRSFEDDDQKIKNSPKKPDSPSAVAVLPSPIKKESIIPSRITPEKKEQKSYSPPSKLITSEKKEQKSYSPRAKPIIESDSSRQTDTETVSQRSRRTRGGEYLDIATKSSRRYLQPARLSGFRNFLCNMLEYKGEMKQDLAFYPIGYICYLLRAYSYDTSSIIPVNSYDNQTLKDLLLKSKDNVKLSDIDLDEIGSIPLIDIYISDANEIVYPITIIYDSGKSTIFMRKDLPNLVHSTDQRFIFILVREIVVENNKIANNSYFPIIIDQKQDRKTIDVISEPTKYDDNMGKIMMQKRTEVINELIDTEGYNIRMYTNIPESTNPRIWQIMMIHLKLINHIGSFEELGNNLLDLFKKENKDIKSITYSYFMKIMRLSVDENVDRELLSI